jgi:hypothetical protein
MLVYPTIIRGEIRSLTLQGRVTVCPCCAVCAACPCQHKRNHNRPSEARVSMLIHDTSIRGEIRSQLLQGRVTAMPLLC